MAKKKRQRKPRSHVKQVKLQQQKNPVSPKLYKKRLRKARRQDFFRVFWTIILLLGVLFLVGIIAGNAWFQKKTGESILDCMADAKRIVAESSAEDFQYGSASEIYSADGVLLATLSESSDSSYLKYDQIPEAVVEAFVAVEDRSFWENSGIDLKGIIRVCVNYVRTGGRVAEGASTITQQLARGKFLTTDKTMTRKIKEIFIARELTKKYSKEQIMEFYCNTCCFANGIYGVEDASQKYFGRTVSDLTLSEIAYICAIPNRPEYYNPLKESQNAVKRRNKILQDMAECGYITTSTCNLAMSESVEVYQVEEEDTYYNSEVTYTINCVCRYLMKLEGFEFQSEFKTDEEYSEYYEQYDEAYRQAKHTLYTGGFKVTTTIEEDTQKALQSILDEQLSYVDNSKDEDNGIYKFQGAMTVIDNDTGKVVAVIGGRSQEETTTYSMSFNRAYQGYAQPGSSIKPLVVYAPALDSGEYSASSRLPEIDVDEAKTSISSEISEMSGTRYTMRNAVEQSRNGCAYWLFNELTPSVGINYLYQMNFSRIVPEDYNLSTALGGLTKGVTTVEMANAYATLEQHGVYTETDCIGSITDKNGNELYEKPSSKRVYSSAAADEMTDIMKGVITDGTAEGLNWYRNTDVEAAAKTGTTNDRKAAWFCGYTPYYTIAVWVGFDTPTAMDNLWGNTYPGYIWRESMLYLVEDLPAREFDLSSYDSSDDHSDYVPVEEPEEEETTEEETEDEATEDEENPDGENTDTIDGADLPQQTPAENNTGDNGNAGQSTDQGTGGTSGSADNGGTSQGAGNDAGTSQDSSQGTADSQPSGTDTGAGTGSDSGADQGSHDSGDSGEHTEGDAAEHAAE